MGLTVAHSLAGADGIGWTWKACLCLASACARVSSPLRRGRVSAAHIPVLWSMTRDARAGSGLARAVGDS